MLKRNFMIVCALLSAIPIVSHAGDDWKTALHMDKTYTDVSKKEWKSKPGYDVVLATTKGEDGRVIVAVVKDAETAPTVIANQKISLNDDCAAPDKKEGFDLTNCTDATLDLAPYHLTETDVAIGVRWKQHAEFPAGESDGEMVALFQLKDGTLKNVLTENMSDESEQRGPGEMLYSKCTLSVAKTKTKDVFDIQKHCTNTSTPLGEADDGPTAPDAKKQTQTTIFRWNGAAYDEVK